MKKRRPGIPKNRIRSLKFTPARMIFFGFIALILLGTALLSLPASTRAGQAPSFADALFTAASSVCVTGLVVADTNTYWSAFGQTVILILIQIGALGIMSVVTLFSVLTGRSLGLSQRLAIKESISNYSLENIVLVFYNILKMTLVIEGTGALLISFALIPRYGFVTGLFKSIFHSVSAFCNAGFDLFGTAGAPFSSLSSFSGDPLMLLATAALIITGGLGFIVWIDMLENKRFSRFTLHTKIVLLMTLILLIVGTAGYMAFESGALLKDLPFGERLTNSFFHAVSARTAGFNTLAVDEMQPVTALFTALLMFIGAAPGSTAGGIKITTAFVLAATVVAFLKGKDDVSAFKKRITMDIINKAVSVFILSLVLIALTTGVLLFFHEGSLLQVFFEAVSAFGTVGLSTGITKDLCDISKYQLVLTMIIGRVGIITAFAAFTSRQGKQNAAYRYPQGEITVG